SQPVDNERKIIMKQITALLVLVSFITLPAFPCEPPAAGPKGAAKGESPFVCDRLAITPAERTRHFEELGPALRALRTEVRELPDGYEFKFPSDAKTLAMVAEFVEQEHRCCPFFDIGVRIEREGGSTWMRFTGRPGTKDFIRAEGADWIRK